MYFECELSTLELLCLSNFSLYHSVKASLYQIVLMTDLHDRSTYIKVFIFGNKIIKENIRMICVVQTRRYS